jgi:hypothetical protein
VWPVSRTIDRYDTTFDHHGLVSNAGLVVTATLMVRLGLEQLTTRWVRTGAPNAGRKLCTLVAAMLAGATHIGHVNVVRAGATQAVLPFRVMAPSTIGTFLRTFTFGFVRQLDAVASRLLARAWELGAGPGDEPLVLDLDSTICEVHGHAKQGAAYGYTKKLGYHPLVAVRADTAEIVFSRMRKGSAGSSRGVNRFVDELAGILRRAKATGPTCVRADSGFWSWELLRTLDRHDMSWSITVTNTAKVQAAIAQIPDDAWQEIDYTDSGYAQVAETSYVGGGRRKRDRRTVRLVVRRTRLADTTQARLFPLWRHHAFITNRHDLDTVAADTFHRHHAVVELAIRDLRRNCRTCGETLGRVSGSGRSPDIERSEAVWLCGGFDGDLVAERFELTDERSGAGLGVPGVVPAGAEVVVVLVVVEHVPDGDEDRVGDSDDGLLLAEAA